MCVRNWRYRDRERKDRRSYDKDDRVGALSLSALMSIVEELRFQLNPCQSETKDSMQSTEFHGLKVLSKNSKHMRILWPAEPFKSNHGFTILYSCPIEEPCFHTHELHHQRLKNHNFACMCTGELKLQRQREIIISTTVDQSALMGIVDEPRVQLNQCQWKQTKNSMRSIHFCNLNNFQLHANHRNSIGSWSHHSLTIL